jgi:hypothetical protein
VRTILRTIVYLWTLPTTLAGLLIVIPTLLTGGRARVHSGVLECHGGFASVFLRRCTILPGGAAAMTLGHVVIGQNAATLTATRSHERVHVRQAERWGPLFIPAYLLASLWALIRGRDVYRDNLFEREAFDRAG